MMAPPPARGVPVVVAAGDLAAGRLLSAGDLRRVLWAPGTAPRAVVTDPRAVIGRTLAGPLSAGSALTAAGLLGPGLLTGQPPGLLAVPVPVSGPDAAGLVEAGDHVDVVSGATGTVVATNAVVLARAAAAGGVDGWAGLGGTSSTGAAGGVLVLAVGGVEAGQLTKAQAAGPLTVAVHGRPSDPAPSPAAP